MGNVLLGIGVLIFAIYICVNRFVHKIPNIPAIFICVAGILCILTGMLEKTWG